VREAAALLKVHIRTVQSWIKSGLRILEGSRPFLIMGHELNTFLATALQKQKQPMKPDEFFCFRCHARVKACHVERVFSGKTMGHDKMSVRLKGFCAVCGGKVNRYDVVPKSGSGETPPSTQVEGL
jgi:hypothetical protein